MTDNVVQLPTRPEQPEDVIHLTIETYRDHNIVRIIGEDEEPDPERVWKALHRALTNAWGQDRGGTVALVMIGHSSSVHAWVHEEPQTAEQRLWYRRRMAEALELLLRRGP